MPPLFPPVQRDDPGIPVPEHPGDGLVRAEAREAIRVMQLKSSPSSRHARSMPESRDPTTTTITATGALAEALAPLFSPTQEREEPFLFWTWREEATRQVAGEVLSPRRVRDVKRNGSVAWTAQTCEPLQSSWVRVRVLALSPRRAAARQLARAGSLTTDGNGDWAGEPNRPAFGLVRGGAYPALPARRDGFDTRRPNQSECGVTAACRAFQSLEVRRSTSRHSLQS